MAAGPGASQPDGQAGPKFLGRVEFARQV